MYDPTYMKSQRRQKLRAAGREDGEEVFKWGGGRVFIQKDENRSEIHVFAHKINI